MMHIVLAILKIIGMILLILIGLVVLAAILILFVPVRYMADVRYVEKADGQVRISWLLRLISARIQIRENQISYTVRICGRKLNLDDEPKPSRKKKPKKKKKKQKNEKNVSEIKETTHRTEQVVLKEKTDKTDSEPVSVERMEAEPKKTQEHNAEEKSSRQHEPSWETEATTKKAGRIKRFLEKLRNIKYTIKSFCAKIGKTKENLSSLWEKFHEDENQQSLRLVKAELLKVWKHIKPRRIRGDIELGTEDPALTAQILGIFAILYPIYQDNLKIRPDFENSRLEGSLYMKGRIRVFPLLMSGIRIYRDKNIRKLIRTVRT